MKRKLKLTKLTVSNLDNVKGGVDTPECGCPYTDPQQGLNIYNLHQTITCVPCVSVVDPCTVVKTQC